MPKRSFLTQTPHRLDPDRLETNSPTNIHPLLGMNTSHAFTKILVCLGRVFETNYLPGATKNHQNQWKTLKKPWFSSKKYVFLVGENQVFPGFGVVDPKPQKLRAQAERSKDGTPGAVSGRGGQKDATPTGTRGFALCFLLPKRGFCWYFFLTQYEYTYMMDRKKTSRKWLVCRKTGLTMVELHLLAETCLKREFVPICPMKRCRCFLVCVFLMVWAALIPHTYWFWFWIRGVEPNNYLLLGSTASFTRRSLEGHMGFPVDPTR